jgi:hypothetical protein
MEQFISRCCGIIILMNAALCSAVAQNSPYDNDYFGAPTGNPLANGSQNIVDGHTGHATVAIPLYTVQAGDISVPITMSYTTTGIKVQDIAGWTGLGWNLSAGGKITRIVKGEPDETPNKGYYDAYAYYNGGVGTSGFNKDGEPDIYTFEFCGRSGYFVLDHHKNPYLIPKQNLTIQRVPYGSSTDFCFVITDEVGNRYYFGDSSNNGIERTEIVRSKPTNSSSPLWALKERLLEILHPNKTDSSTPGFISTWNLVKIKSYKGNIVVFNYGAHTYEYTQYLYRRFSGGISAHNGDPYTISTVMWEPRPGGLPPEPKTYYHTINRGHAHMKYTTASPLSLTTETVSGSPEEDISSKIKITGSYLTSISWNNGTVTFNSNDQRTDLQEGRKLNRINISAFGGAYQRAFDFEYSNFPAPANHLCLESISLSSNEKKKRIADFEYYRVHNLPTRDSGGYDQDGLCNGEFSTNHTTGPKNGRLEYAQAGILTGINYETGAQMRFEYGFNRGLRVEKHIVTDGENSYTREYKYIKNFQNPPAKPLSSERILDSKRHFKRDESYEKYNNDGLHTNCFIVVEGTYSQPMNRFQEPKESPIIYSEVAEVFPDGSFIIRKYSDNDNLKYVGKYLPDEGVWQPNSWGNWVPARTSMAYMRGLLLEEAMYKPGNTVPVKKTTYTYRQDISKRSIIRAFQPSMSAGGHLHDPPKKYIAIYDWYSEPVLLESVIVEGGPYNLRVETSHVYDPDHLVPIRTIVKDSEGNEYETEIKYPFSYNYTLAPNPLLQHIQPGIDPVLLGLDHLKSNTGDALTF